MIELEHNAPDLEDLAAYLDGRLDGERKAQVEERLLRDEDYYDLFLENVRYQEEQAGQHGKGGGEVVKPVAWQSWKVIVPLAVAATLVVAVSAWRLNQGPPTGEWVAQLSAAEIVSQEGWDQPGWSVLRSSNIPKGRYSPEELAFRIGLRAVDLQVAFLAEDRGAATKLTHLLRDLANNADLFAENAAYRDLLRQIETGDLETLAKQAAFIETLLAESFEASPQEARQLRLGGWTEAGRLAALSGNAEILAKVLHDRRDVRTVKRIAPHLQDLETVVEQSNPNEQDFEAAFAAFSEIVKALAG